MIYLNRIAKYLPSAVLTNHDLEKMVETSDAWIQTRTGIAQRHIAAEDETTLSMAECAARAVLNGRVDIDLVIVATMTPDQLCPGVAAPLATRLGLKNPGAFDLQAACSGAVYALAAAHGMMQTTGAQRCLVVAAEKMSSIIDYSDRTTCVLFGDGASAFLLSVEKEGWALGPWHFGSDGAGKDWITIPSGGAADPPSFSSLLARRHTLTMQGPAVFKAAITRMEESVRCCCQQASLQPEQLHALVAHQANGRILASLAQRLGLPLERCAQTLQQTGNTSAASVGIALASHMQHVPPQPGEHWMLTAFGAGAAWGSGLLTRV